MTRTPSGTREKRWNTHRTTRATPNAPTQHSKAVPPTDGDLDRAIARGAWGAAERLARSLLKETPSNHTLFTAEANALYEQYKYRQALRSARRGLKLAPRCPQLLLQAAGALDMLGEEKAAIALYDDIIRQGRRGLTRGPCAESALTAEGILADAYFRIARCRLDLGELWPGIDALQRFISKWSRASTYSLSEGRRLLKAAQMLVRRRAPPTNGGSMGQREAPPLPRGKEGALAGKRTNGVRRRLGPPTPRPG